MNPSIQRWAGNKNQSRRNRKFSLNFGLIIKFYLIFLAKFIQAAQIFTGQSCDCPPATLASPPLKNISMCRTDNMTYFTNILNYIYKYLLIVNLKKTHIGTAITCYYSLKLSPTLTLSQ